MDGFDLVVRGGTVVTSSEVLNCDVGVTGGRIAAIGTGLRGTREIDAAGLLVLPGGVDTHCHIEQLQKGGGADEEGWVTGSVACLAGGTTSVVTFSTQFKGGGILEPLAEYRRRAGHARRRRRRGAPQEEAGQEAGCCRRRRRKGDVRG